MIALNGRVCRRKWVRELMNEEEIVMDARVRQAVATFRNLWNDDQIPVSFEVEGQDFDERCEAWVLHAIEQIEDEIEYCKELSPNTNEKKGA
jgi:hypothetical protein